MSKPVFSDLFKFSGRRNRKSYVLFLLAVIAVEIVIGIVMMVAGGMGSMMTDEADAMGGMSAGAAIIAIPVWIVLAVMSIAVGSQRCRDFGWTGWAMLLVLVPVVGWIFALAIIFIPGTEGDNRYGPDPLQVHG